MVVWTEFHLTGMMTSLAAAINLCPIASSVPGTGLSQGQGAGINFSDSSLSKIAADEGAKCSRGRKS